MTTTNQTNSMMLDLTLREQWVIHHIMLDSIGYARSSSVPVEEPHECTTIVIENIEDNEFSFTPFELDHIRHTCRLFLSFPDIAESDRASASDVVKQIDRLLHGTDPYLSQPIESS